MNFSSKSITLAILLFLCSTVGFAQSTLVPEPNLTKNLGIEAGKSHAEEKQSITGEPAAVKSVKKSAKTTSNSERLIPVDKMTIEEQIASLEQSIKKEKALKRPDMELRLQKLEKLLKDKKTRPGE